MITIRNGNGPSFCAKVDEIVANKMSISDLRKMYGGNTKKYLASIYEFPTEYKADTEPNKALSVSKCGPIKAFDIRSFTNTWSSPLAENKCEVEKHISSDHTDEHTDAFELDVFESQPGPSACDSSMIEKAADLTKVSKEIEASVWINENCQNEIGRVDLLLQFANGVHKCL